MPGCRQLASREYARESVAGSRFDEKRTGKRLSPLRGQGCARLLNRIPEASSELAPEYSPTQPPLPAPRTEDILHVSIVA